MSRWVVVERGFFCKTSRLLARPRHTFFYSYYSPSYRVTGVFFLKGFAMLWWLLLIYCAACYLLVGYSMVANYLRSPHQGEWADVLGRLIVVLFSPVIVPVAVAVALLDHPSKRGD